MLAHHCIHSVECARHHIPLSPGQLPIRMYSYYGNPGQSGSNEYALLMVETLPLVIILFNLKQTNFRRGLLLISLLSMAYCLTRTRSRAGIIGLAVLY